MPAIHEITTLDTVELTEPIAGVLELRGDDVAMIEITSMPLEPVLDRIVFAPLSKLRRVG